MSSKLPPPPHLTKNYKDLLNYHKQNASQSATKQQQIGQLQARQSDVMHSPIQQQGVSSQLHRFGLSSNRKREQIGDQISSRPDKFPRKDEAPAPVNDNMGAAGNVEIENVKQAKQKQILHLLKQFPRPVSTKEIIQNCGHSVKYQLQPLIYDLSDRGLIIKVSVYGGPQAWKLNLKSEESAAGKIVESKTLQHSKNETLTGTQNRHESFHDHQFPRPSFSRGHTKSSSAPNIVINSLKNTSGPPLPPHLMIANENRNDLRMNTNDIHQRSRTLGSMPGSIPPQSTGSIPPQSTGSIPPRLTCTSSVDFTVKSKKQTNFQLLSSDTFNALNKNPVSALNEMAQKNGLSVAFELLSEGRGFKNKFTMAAKIGEQMYDAVSASNIKDARRDAADIALRAILAQSANNTNLNNATKVMGNVLSPTSTALSHFDNIAMLSHHAFLQISAMVQEKFAGRKVIACMIMKNGFEDTGRVIALGTGNRCITGQRLSLEGKVLNDSHAEIVCRRAFLRFLYSQLDCLYSSGETIFEHDCSSNKAKLKGDVTFHLYISTAPCGDSALFTPREEKGLSTLSKEHIPTFTSKPHGILRTKIENGEGTIPIVTGDSEQTFDGILRGERLRTMSCSDKICRWNVLGLQGALLSHLTEPIYLESLTLGYLYDHGHLCRAICCRLDKEKNLNDELPMPFYLNHPWIGRVTKYEAGRETEKTNNISINWCASDTCPEVTDGRTGACLTRTHNAPTPSRLCKLELYKCFRRIAAKNSHCAWLLDIETYGEVKKLAQDFQSAKKCMFQKFRSQKFGQWVRKPGEQDMFSCL